MVEQEPSWRMASDKALTKKALPLFAIRAVAASAFLSAFNSSFLLATQRRGVHESNWIVK